MDIRTTTALLAAGVTRYMLDLRCRPGGPWQRLLPGVVLLAGGPPTRDQLVRAALLYVGVGAALTGVDALRVHGLDLPPPDRVHVLQPAGRRRAGNHRVLVERTTRLPLATVACPVRAAVDAARHDPDPLHQHYLLAKVVDAGLATVTELRTELEAGPRRGTAVPRAALRSLSTRPDLRAMTR
ncbi:hypothetical protein GCM10022243_62370 [Saccharothrix violaceirubra]|uniref:Uncharacterized protein n=1 Tax=Saccharothrix violaceirubra TaxID=413306 RepID=A0A7W7T812_9PSEU|nr:hypothetical protein [Saccharothrix violaceirubra]MBB4968215.1 hypothetical protein [Saccharothrix violaceirubra]